MQWLDNFLRLCRISRDARRENAPREWLFVHAYGPEQTRPGYPQTYGEALEFMRFALQGRFVRVDFDNSIIFFDCRKLDGRNS